MKAYQIVISCVLLLIGVVVGTIINDFPVLKLNREVRFFEPLSFLATISVALAVPFYVKRLIDDGRHVKLCVIDELKETLKEVELIRDKLRTCYFKDEITAQDKIHVTILFEQADLKVINVNNRLLDLYDKQTKDLQKRIKEEYMSFWKIATSSEIMTTTYKRISESNLASLNQHYSCFEDQIKKCITIVNKI